MVKKSSAVEETCMADAGPDDAHLGPLLLLLLLLLLSPLLLLLLAGIITLRGSVVDPDPHGSGTFAWIRIRNSENSKLDPE